MLDLAVYRLFNTRTIPEHQVFNFFTVLKIIIFTSWKSFVCIHKNYLSIYLYAIFTPPNFITMIICIERKKQNDYWQLNKPCSTSSWVSKKMIQNLILFICFFVFSDQWTWSVLTQIIEKHCYWWFPTLKGIRKSWFKG